MSETVSPQELREAAYAAANLGKQFRALILIADVLRDVESLDRRYQTLVAKREEASANLIAQTQILEVKKTEVGKQLAGLNSEYSMKRTALEAELSKTRAAAQNEMTQLVSEARRQADHWQAIAKKAKLEADEAARSQLKASKEWAAELSATQEKVAALKAEFKKLSERLSV